MLHFLPVHVLPQGRPSFACETSVQFLLPSKARLWLFWFLPGFPWAWADGDIPCVPPPLDLGFQHPVCDSGVGRGAASVVSLAGFQGHCWEHVWDFGLLGPIPGTAAKRFGLRRGSFYSGVKHLPVFPIQNIGLLLFYLLSPLPAVIFHSGSSYA